MVVVAHIAAPLAADSQTAVTDHFVLEYHLLAQRVQLGHDGHCVHGARHKE